MSTAHHAAEHPQDPSAHGERGGPGAEPPTALTADSAAAPATDEHSATGAAGEALFTRHRYLTLILVLLLSVALILFTQQMKLWMNPESTPITWTTIGGLASLWLFSMIGLAIGDLTKKYDIPVAKGFPVLGWVSIASLVGCLLWPGFVTAISGVDFLSITVPILAFAGISVADRLVDLSKTSWKVAITAVFVFIGTYLGSAIIAQIGLTLSGS